MADDDDSSGSSTPYKLAVVARTDLGMTAGKLASQVGHAVHDAVRGASASKMSAWEEDGSMIVVLQVSSEANLRAVTDIARAHKIATFDVIDEGLTEVEDGELTAVAVGPDEVQQIDVVTGRLQLYTNEAEVEDLRRRLKEAEAELKVYRSGGGVIGGDAATLPALPALRGGEAWFVCDVKLEEHEMGSEGIPDMFELWTWEGDRSILPLKWADALKAGYDAESLSASGAAALRPWESPGFDEDGIFFLTHRSDTCGVAAILPAKSPHGAGDQPVGFIAGWCVHPDFRRRGVGLCLLRSCLRRQAEMGRRRVFCAIDERSCVQAVSLLTKEGFRKCTDA